MDRPAKTETEKNNGERAAFFSFIDFHFLQEENQMVRLRLLGALLLPPIIVDSTRLSGSRRRMKKTTVIALSIGAAVLISTLVLAWYVRSAQGSAIDRAISGS